jgi:hypothetical protein
MGYDWSSLMGGSKSSGPAMSTGKGGGEKQWDRNAPEDNGQPNVGGGHTAGLRQWQKPRQGTSPPMPWDNNPGPTVPKMASLGGGEHDWQRSGYHAVPDPSKLVD